MNNFTIKDFVKYGVFAFIVYYLIKIIPTTQITQRDVILIMFVIAIAYYFINYVNKEKFLNNKELFSQNINVSATMEPKSFEQINTPIQQVKTINATTTMEPKVSPVNASINASVIMEPKRFVISEQIPSEEESKIISEEESRIITEEGKIISEESLLQNGKILSEEEQRAIIEERAMAEEQRLAIKEGRLARKMITRRVVKNGQVQYITEPEEIIGQETVVAERNGTVITAEIVAAQPRIIKAGDNSRKYFNLLMEDLFIKGIFDNSDMDNMNKKIELNILTLDEAIDKLEKLRGSGIKKSTKDTDRNEEIYEESSLPTAFYQPLGDDTLVKWDNEFALLNTEKWSVPMPRPPVCINTSPCKVCPSSTSGNGANLKEWNSIRKVMNTKESRKIIDAIPEIKSQM